MKSGEFVEKKTLVKAAQYKEKNYDKLLEWIEKETNGALTLIKHNEHGSREKIVHVVPRPILFFVEIKENQWIVLSKEKKHFQIMTEENFKKFYHKKEKEKEKEKEKNTNVFNTNLAKRY